MSTPYRTLDDVVKGFSALEARYRAAHDRRAIFLTLYSVVSAEMRDRVAARRFEDHEWVHRYAVAFANLYRQAVDAYDAGDTQRVPKAWRLCFDAAKAGSGLVLTDMLLGVNAHVNHDLPYAIDGIAIGPDRQKRYRDHSAVNAVLGAVTERATLQVSQAYAPGIAGLDRAAGNLDEVLSAFSLEVARESAWESALALANARDDGERQRVMNLIGIRAAAVARLLRAPAHHSGVILVCREVEAGPRWLTLVASACSPAVDR
jgi:hypothetical protein